MSQQSSGGISFCGLLTVLFIGLKLTGYITWPWIWVVSPLWIPISAFLGIALTAGIFYLILRLLEYLIREYSKKRVKKSQGDSSMITKKTKFKVE